MHPPPPGLRVRPYRAPDSGATAALLYESSGGMYDRYAGNRKLAERTIARALEREGNTASADVVWVADLDGLVVGAMAAMPYDDWTGRAHRFLRVTLSSVPPWRWLGALWLYRASGRTAPAPPRRCFYVDSLATERRHRRIGVARALLDEAARQARDAGLGCLALDTWVDNRPARALYKGYGFEEVGRRPAVSGLPGGVSLLKRLP